MKDALADLASPVDSQPARWSIGPRVCAARQGWLEDAARVWRRAGQVLAPAPRRSLMTDARNVQIPRHGGPSSGVTRTHEYPARRSSGVRLLVPLLVLIAGCLAPAADVAPAPGAAPAALVCPVPCRTLVAPPAYGTREPPLAVDPGDPDHLLGASMTFDVVGEAVGRLHLQIHESWDGAASWTTRPLDLPGAAPTTETYNAAPAFLPDGTPLVAAVAVEGRYGPLGPVQGAARVVVLRGAGLADLVVLDEGGGAEVPAVGAAVAVEGFDKPSLAVGADAVHAAWSARERPTPLDVQRLTLRLATSRDGGATWTRAEAPLFDLDVVSGPGVVLPDGAAVFPVAGVRGSPSDLDMECALVVGRGDTWEALELGACAWVPAVAAHGSELRVVVPRAADTVLRASADLGATWTPETILDVLDAPGATVPALATLADGRAVATFFHPREKGTSYHAVLVEGDAVVSRVVLDAALEREPRFLGNYFGLAPTREGAVATWVSEEGGVTVVASAVLAAS